MQTSLPRLGACRRFGAAALVLLFAAAITAGGAAASVISPSPTLPPANGVYVGEAALGCFPAAGVCAGRGTLSITSVISSTFGPSGQELELYVLYSNVLTDLSHTPIGAVSLTGELDESIAGRLGPDDIGAWATGLDLLDLSGTVLGDAVSVGLDPNNPTNGETSITPTGPDFLITSFFDVFAEITIDTPTGPLMTTRGPLRADLVPLPEPATILLLGASAAGLFLIRRRRDPGA